MKKFIAEFKEFAVKGNMIDLAVGVIIGGAFNTVIKSIVDDVLMPVIGIIIGGQDFSKFSIVIGDAEIKYGAFIQNILNFLLIALFLFIMVKFINRLKRHKEAAIIKEEEAPPKSEDIILLEEIRDLLAKQESKEK